MAQIYRHITEMPRLSVCNALSMAVKSRAKSLENLFLVHVRVAKISSNILVDVGIVNYINELLST
jgi:hypothetical protein